MSANPEVEAYLWGNFELREALGIASDAELAVEPLGKGEHNENYVFSVADGDVAGGGATGAAPGGAEPCGAASGGEAAGGAAPCGAAGGGAIGAAPGGVAGGGAAPCGAAKFVLRINRLPQPFHQNQVAYEYAALKALEPSGCTPRALYLDDSPTSLGKGVLVESFCQGQELDFDHLRPGDLRCAAQLMADVHAVPVPDDCPLFRPKDPLRELLAECVSRYDVYKGTALEDPRFSRWIDRFFAATQEAVDAAPEPDGCGHIINTETLPSHFMIGASGSEEAAAKVSTADGGAGAFCSQPGTFVDWERPIVAEVAQDLAFFVAPSTTFWDSEYLFPRQNIQAFLDDYWRAVDGRFERGGFDQRFEAFLRVSVLRSQTWFCKNAARYANGGTGHTTERTFAKWAIYTSDEFNEMLLRECFQ